MTANRLSPVYPERSVRRAPPQACTFPAFRSKLHRNCGAEIPTWSGRSDVRTFRPADVPILELTALSTIPSPLMHLRGTHFATLLFSSSCMEWGGYPLDVRTFTRFDAFPTYHLSFH